jgi:hypothetical protein
MPSVSIRTLIIDSLLEIGAYSPQTAPPIKDVEFCLGRLNQIVDNWNATREAIYAEVVLPFTFISSQQDYTIGPSAADFTVTQRPVSIESACVVLTNVIPNVRNGITMRDYQWWDGLTVQAVTTTFPTDLYYEPNWPNGILHFWPTPDTPYGLELTTRKTLDEVTINDTFSMPPGYLNAVMLTLAEDISSTFGRTLSPTTIEKARAARHRIFMNNDFTPSLVTQDAGMPSNSRNRCSFNYRTGLDMNSNR